jgi:hypothetical protein
MSVNLQHQAIGNNSTDKAQSSLGKSGRKAPGTRVGLLFDWRQSSKKMPSRHGRAFRDGR